MLHLSKYNGLSGTMQLPIKPNNGITDAEIAMYLKPNLLNTKLMKKIKIEPKLLLAA